MTSLAMGPALRDSGFLVTSAGTEQRRGRGLALEEALSEPLGQITHGLERTDEVAEPLCVNIQPNSTPSFLSVT
ncbi:MAG: hypothetical protein RQ847_07830, partial [Wenzhouxiangellaceae bacterium]|nr:hypothetical protein [Wenzhouxiangellaceae bacterium]